MTSDLAGMRVVMLNGPPGCGKDTAGRAICAGIEGAYAVKFAAPLKRATHELFGLADLPDDAFEGDAKNRPHPAFFGHSPRHAYIEVSEKFAKPVFGADFFGRVMLHRLADLREAGVTMAVVTDSGFLEEAEPVIEAVGSENCLLVHIARPGHDFAGDSRGYWRHPHVVQSHLVNAACEKQWRYAAVRCVGAWLDRQRLAA